MLATRQQVKDRLGFASADTEHDAVIDRLLVNVSDLLAREAGRVAGGVACLEKATVTEVFSPELRDKVLWLTARPVISVTSIKEALYGAYADATALTAASDYWLNNAFGRLTRIGWWLAGDETVQAVYVGGYVLALAWVSGTSYVAGDCVTSGGAIYECILAVSGSTAPASDETHWTLRTTYTALPGEINEAAIQQAQFFFTRRTSIGQSATGVQGASLTMYQQDDLLPDVKRIMARYRRIA